MTPRVENGRSIQFLKRFFFALRLKGSYHYSHLTPTLAAKKNSTGTTAPILLFEINLFN